MQQPGCPSHREAQAGPVRQERRTLFRCKQNRLILVPVCLGRLPIRHHGGAVIHRPRMAGTGWLVDVFMQTDVVGNARDLYARGPRTAAHGCI